MIKIPNKIHVKDLSKFPSLLSKKRNKYSAEKTLYNGIKFDSKKEANYCKQLDLLIKAKEVIRYELQVPFKCIVNDKLICTYRLDFKVYYKDKIEHIDVKGFRNNVYIIKKKLVEALYNIEIIEK